MAFVLLPFIYRVLGDVLVAPHEFTGKQEGTLPERELMPIKPALGVAGPDRALEWFQQHSAQVSWGR